VRRISIFDRLGPASSALGFSPSSEGAHSLDSSARHHCRWLLDLAELVKIKQARTAFSSEFQNPAHTCSMPYWLEPARLEESFCTASIISTKPRRRRIRRLGVTFLWSAGQSFQDRWRVSGSVDRESDQGKRNVSGVRQSSSNQRGLRPCDPLSTIH